MQAQAARTLHIDDGRTPRPEARRILYCDGVADGTYREGIDLELSHWIPNRTPRAFKADSSTEICMKFVEAGDGDHDLVVNNHTDVDGMLSAFVLLFGELALRHRQTIVQAAEMGDFWGWGDRPARELFQGLVCLIAELRERETAAEDIHRRGFERIRAILSGTRFPEGEDGLAALDETVARIEEGTIPRTEFGPRFAGYIVPRVPAERDLAAALDVPEFNIPLSRATLLSPYARARFDRERVQLVSVAVGNGWYHDLWYPGYVWAETVSLWRPAGIESAGDSNVHRLHFPSLARAAAFLGRSETADGRWTLADGLSPFGTIPGRNFPVVLSFMKDGRPSPSALPPGAVAGVLAPAFADA